jgi:hypothetical protein
LDFWSNPPSELAPADDQNLGGAFETWDTSDGRGAPLESCDEGGDGHVRIARQARLRRERDNRLKNSPRRHRLLVNIGGEQLDPGRVVGGLSRFDAEVNMEQDILHRGVALHPALLRRRQFDEAGDLRSGASGAVVVPWRVARKERDLPRGRTCSISGRTKSLAWVVGSLALPAPQRARRNDIMDEATLLPIVEGMLHGQPDAGATRAADGEASQRAEAGSLGS